MPGKTSNKTPAAAPDKKPARSSKTAISSTGVTGLFYATDDKPGFTRVVTTRTGKDGKKVNTFRYRDTKGQWIKDAEDVQRINKLAIPPAYTDVWICPSRNGHLQATGKDARGRKQYRYHPDWQVQRNDNKFDRLQTFGSALPRLRARVTRDLTPKRNQPVSRTLVLATMVRLLDTTFVRVGNDEYARENGSFGLTTLRNPHAGVKGSTIKLRFRGKSGVMQDLSVNDPKVATVVRRCQQLPGQLLFQYEDEAGELHGVGSSDVNDYLSEITASRRKGEEHFTAKDFRTWHGTVQALELTRLACSGSEPNSYNAKSVLAEVARQLGNTPAVCKKSYIHPAVMSLGSELADDANAMAGIWNELAAGKPARHLRAAEARLMAFLKAKKHREKPARRKAAAA
jgi:DNA topoisomerase-1